MLLKNLHKFLGLVMLIPLLLWAITGLVFLTKPGYNAAYEQLSPTLYRFDRPIQLDSANNWSEARLLKTVLGYHLLVLKEGNWKHLDPFTLTTKPQPTADDVRALISDATKHSPDRYGTIIRVEGTTAFTDTDVAITLAWNALSLRQKGPDSRLIDTLYRIHYLQWSGSPAVNLILGVSGLALLVGLTLAGLVTFMGARRKG